MSDGTCTIDGCERPVRSRGWCEAHYSRWWRNGDPGDAAVAPFGKPAGAPCIVDGCERSSTSRGWCRAHYIRWQRYGDPEGTPTPRPPAPTCGVEGCNGKHYGRGLCHAHWIRLRRRGTVEKWQPPPKGKCTVESCAEEEYAHGRGLCNRHNLRLVRHGDVNYEREGVSTYSGIHVKVTRQRGKASTHRCVECGSKADQWAYNHSDPNEMWEQERTLVYSTDMDYYQPMCFGCHKAFDAADAERRMLGEPRR